MVADSAAPTHRSQPTVILAGCGYGAIESLRALQGLAKVIAINPYPYIVNSGMTTRLLSGRFSEEMVKIPLLDHIQAHGAEYLQGQVTHIQPRHSCLCVDLEGHSLTLRYDLLLINVGRQVATHGIPGVEFAHTVRPMQNLIQARQQVIRCWQRAQTGDRTPGLLTFVVVGGGFSGVELVGELYDLCRELSRQTGIPLARARLILVARSRPAQEISPQFSDRVNQSLRRNGIEILTPAEVTALSHEFVSVRPRTGSESFMIPCLTCLWAAGLQVPPWLSHCGLPTAADGSLQVDQTLRVKDSPNILAMGDCATFVRSGSEATPPEPLPKIGVYAVRAGPAVAENLARWIQDQPLRPFQPQSTVFISVTVGNRVAVMQKGRWVWRGWIATFLKNLFDWLYMRQLKPVRWQDFFY